MSNKLWTHEELRGAIEGSFEGPVVSGYCCVSIDSRTIKKGAIFFAIQGENFDGHDFAIMAYENGAALLVIEEEKAQDLRSRNLPLLVVKNSLQALEQLAIASRSRSKASIIAITGSVGKTSLKEVLASILSLYGKTHANYASYNNHWGVPLSLASMERDASYGIFELGMNHTGELLALGAMVKPDITVITAIAPAHIGNFANIEEIASAKSEIYIHQNPEGLALIKAEDKYKDFLCAAAKKAQIKHIQFFTKEVEHSSNSMAYNLSASIKVLNFLQLDTAQAKTIFDELKPLKGRGEIVKLSQLTIIDESYNANPYSMEQAIVNLTHYDEPGRKILVLGDMLELGAYSSDMHRNLAQFIEGKNFALVYLMGKEMQHLAQALSTTPYFWFENAEEALEAIMSGVKPNDIIMLKSSNNIKTYKIVEALKEKYR